MKDNRPVNLDITTIRFPLAAIASIIHRISGGLLFVGVALLLYLLQLSLESEAGFEQAAALINNTAVKLVLWMVLAGLAYHLVAGLKHLLLDLGIGESKQGARLGALMVIVLAAVAIAALGLWLW